MSPSVDGHELRADCARCEALCCVAPAFARGADFAITKPAGRPCPNLADDSRCTVHDRLRPRGFGGCVAYDCFGAGQRLIALGGPSWRAGPAAARDVFATFEVLTALHELLWYLQTALALPVDGSMRAELTSARDETAALAARSHDQLPTVEVEAARSRVNPVLASASEQVRAAAPGPRAELRGAALIEADLRRRDLRAANLRGTVLVGADLRGVDLGRADLTGADLRGARVGGADLSGAIFVRPAQLESARGDRTTRLPAELGRPAHWS